MHFRLAAVWNCCRGFPHANNKRDGSTKIISSLFVKYGDDSILHEALRKLLIVTKFVPGTARCCVDCSHECILIRAKLFLEPQLLNFRV